MLRACIGLLTLVGGIGIALYGLAALWSVPAPAEHPLASPPTDHRRHLALGAGTAAILLAARAIGLWPGDDLMVPATAVAAGLAVVWALGAGVRAGRIDADVRVLRAVQVVAGVALMGAGVYSLARRTGGLASTGASASAIAIVIGGIAMLGAPAAARLIRSLDEERGARIREEERAALAAHLHDSVLQSLVLIQRNDDPRRMASLARRQERELRAWLYGSARQGEPTTLHAAIEALTLEIERDHDLRVEAVVVGDQPLDTASRALVAAIREALVNTARHAGVDHVDVFVEADDTELTGFVRDTGRGFDHAQVPVDRRGIRESIVGRAQRVGGAAAVQSTCDVGTEVEIRIPRHSGGLSR